MKLKNEENLCMSNAYEMKVCEREKAKQFSGIYFDSN